jgi:hypothetical protein
MAFHCAVRSWCSTPLNDRSPTICNVSSKRSANYLKPNAPSPVCCSKGWCSSTKRGDGSSNQNHRAARTAADNQEARAMRELLACFHSAASATRVPPYVCALRPLPSIASRHRRCARAHPTAEFVGRFRACSSTPICAGYRPCSSMKRNAEAGRASVSPTRAAAKTKSPRCARAFCLQPFHGESCVTRIRCAKAHPNVRVMALKQETRAVRGLLASFGGTRFAGAALLIAPYGRHCAARPFTCIWLL